MIADPLGATLLGDARCRFLVWAPKVESVAVRLLNDDRCVPLDPLGSGYRQSIVDGVGVGDRYRFVLGGDRELPDPASRRQPDGVHGPSAVDDPESFPWTDTAWTGRRLRDVVVYEIHVGAFTPEGTFDAAADRLDDLVELGITAVELMPVAAFPGERNWGYDGVFPYAVQETYGGPRGLRRFVDACHARGLSVVIDVVNNHLGPEGNVLDAYGPYFTDRHRNPWGAAIDVDGPGSDAVRRYFIGAAEMWVRAFHVDALRIDAVHSIVDRSPAPFLAELSQRMEDLASDLRRPLLLFGETDRRDERVVAPRDRGGLGMDARWSNDLHHALHALLTGERSGYYAGLGSVADLATALEDGASGERVVVFSQNHDQVGNRARGDRLSGLTDLEGLKLAAATVVLSPFVPLLFMGEEYGETAPFPYFLSLSDAGLAEMVRRGRRAEFASFGWGGEVPDPQDERTYRTARLRRSLAGSEPHRSLRALYRELLRLRREVPALARLRPEEAHLRPEETSRTLAIRRLAPQGSAMLLLAFRDAPVELVQPFSGHWRRILDTADARWAGPGTPSTVVADSDPGPLRLAPRSAVLFVEGPA